MLPEPTTASGETRNLGFETPHAQAPGAGMFRPPRRPLNHAVKQT